MEATHSSQAATQASNRVAAIEKLKETLRIGLLPLLISHGQNTFQGSAEAVVLSPIVNRMIMAARRPGWYIRTLVFSGVVGSLVFILIWQSGWIAQRSFLHVAWSCFFGVLSVSVPIMLLFRLLGWLRYRTHLRKIEAIIIAERLTKKEWDEASSFFERNPSTHFARPLLLSFRAKCFDS